MAAKHSLDAGLFFRDGAHAAWNDSYSSSLVELDIVGDVEYTSENERAEIRDRSSTFVEGVIGKRVVELTFQLTYDNANALYIMLENRHEARTGVSLLVLDDDDATTVGARGIWALWDIVNFDKSESLSEAQTVSVTCAPRYNSVKPEYVVIGGGS